MIKKTLFILTVPFRLLYYVVVTPFRMAWLILKITGLILGDTIKRSPQKRPSTKAKASDLMDIGKVLFTGYENEFEAYYQLYLSDKKQFHATYPIDRTNDEEPLTPIEALQAFGDDQQKTGFIDWKGEEEPNEIEEFIAAQISASPLWTNTVSLRNSVPENRQRDGKFIVKLFKAIDKDLQTIQLRLLFLDLGWDAYVFLPTTKKTFDQVLEKAPNYFQRVEEL